MAAEKKADKKHADFERLIAQRVAKAKDGIRLVGNMSNRRYYDYDGAEADEAISALEEELCRARERFDDGLRKAAMREGGGDGGRR